MSSPQTTTNSPYLPTVREMLLSIAASCESATRKASPKLDQVEIKMVPYLRRYLDFHPVCHTYFRVFIHNLFVYPEMKYGDVVVNFRTDLATDTKFLMLSFESNFERGDALARTQTLEHIQKFRRNIVSLCDGTSWPSEKHLASFLVKPPMAGVSSDYEIVIPIVGSNPEGLQNRPANTEWLLTLRYLQIMKRLGLFSDEEFFVDASEERQTIRLHLFSKPAVDCASANLPFGKVV